MRLNFNYYFTIPCDLFQYDLGLNTCFNPSLLQLSAGVSSRLSVWERGGPAGATSPAWPRTDL